MAKARSRTIERPRTNVELDDSSDHPALTPLMWRLAREKWQVVRAKAAEQGLPIVEAWLSPRWDTEGGPVVFLDVHLDCSRERADAFITASTPTTTAGSPNSTRRSGHASRRGWSRATSLCPPTRTFPPSSGR